MTLNEEQRRAVETAASKVVVIAGPGSGKTRVEVERVKWIARGLDSIAIMTFTNAGAAEFRERLGDLADKLAWCGTTHSYCFQLIQRFGDQLGYKSGTVSILPKDEKLPRLLRVQKELGIKMSQADLLKNELPDAHLVWKQYEFLLKQSNTIDYDLILADGLQLLRLDAVRARVRVDHLLVDEFQDSKAIDVAIYEAIPATNRFYVGDPDQSIFAFRDADPSFLMHIEGERHKLEMNYRSGVAICHTANALIAHNKDRIPKISISASGLPSQVELDEYADGYAELDAIAGCISMTLVTRQSIAVLYRNNFEVEECVRSLTARGFPVKARLQMKPRDLDRAILLLSMVLSPDNEILFERYLLCDYKPAVVANTLHFMKANKISVREKTSRLTGDDNLTMLARAGVSESTIRLIVERAKMFDGEHRSAELIQDLRSYDPVTETTDDSEAEIYVGTYHSAKGREWSVVFLPAFEQGLIPHTSQDVRGVRDLEAETNILEEERRLAFVALTRARNEVNVSWAAKANGKWGPRSLGRPSQFLSEMGL